MPLIVGLSGLGRYYTVNTKFIRYGIMRLRPNRITTIGNMPLIVGLLGLKRYYK